MKKAFTLIELLVVLLLITLVISLIAPKGYQLLAAISKKIEDKELDNQIKIDIYQAFISEKNSTINELTINNNGIIVNETK